MKVDVTTVHGAKAGSVDLPDEMFGIKPNRSVMHQVVTAQLAAARSGTHSTKTRAEVKGGGAKPWRQKGTGRARQGSIRSPQWRGGGVAHGPVPRSYAQRTPKKMVKLALRSALSDRAADERVMVVDDWGIDEPSTKRAVSILDELGLRKPGERDPRTLLVLDRGRGRDVEVVPQPRSAGADRAPRGAERLRRARQRLARLQPGDARRVPQPRGCQVSSRNPRDIIIRPVVSEKSYAAYDANVYTFLVAPDANKIEIKQAIESIFSVKVTNVNTVNRKGKRKRNRRTGDWGKRSDQRRAIVSLADGDSIEIFGS